MLERVPAKKPVIGIFAVAHGTYWHQFPGLRRICKNIIRILWLWVAKNEVEIVDLGIVDDSTRQMKQR